jgi:hypothetical protein
MVWPLLIAAGASLVGGLIGAKGSSDAAKTQAEASDRALALQREIYTQNRSDLEPWRGAGVNALNQLGGELGGGFRTSPGYEFARSEGLRGVDNAFASSGMFNSGARAKGIARFTTGLADQEYGNYLNRLAAMAGIGQTATGQGVQLGQNFGINAGNTLENAGAARASGYAGSANAWGNAFNNLGYLAGQWGGGGGGNALYDPTSGNWTPGPGGF